MTIAAPGNGISRRPSRRFLLGAAASLAVGALAALVWPSGAAEASVQHGEGIGRPVVLVGVTGLRWDDLSPATTPTLWRLTDDGSAGSLSVRTVRPRTCAVDGWLTVNAGARATAERAGGENGPCPPIEVTTTAGGGARVAGFADVVAHNDEFGYDPEFGLLRARVTDDPGCPQAVGPGAAVALADAEGRLPRYAETADFLGDPELRRLLGRCALTVADLGALPEDPEAARDRAVAEADSQLTRMVESLPSQATLVVAGVADSGTTPHLHTVIVRGPGYGPSWLTAPSTRQSGLVQLTDLTPTLIAMIGQDVPDSLVGSVMREGEGRPAGVEAAVERLTEDDTAAQVIRDSVTLFFVIVAAGSLLALGTAVFWRRGLVVYVSLGLGASAGATFLANLVPWWRAERPGLGLTLLVVAWTMVVTVAALAGPWRRHPLGPAGFVALATSVVLGLDVAFGSPLQISSLHGLSTLVAGRFYGFGNVAFAIFAMVAVFAAAWLAEPLVARGRRRDAALVIAGFGLAAVIVDGWPTLGSDFGGILALVPAFALLAISVSGMRLSVYWVSLAGLGALLMVSTIAVLDWLRPADERSHLGRFVQQVLDGEAADVVRRKAITNLNSLTGNVLGVIVPLAFVALAVLLARPERLRATALVRAFEQVATLRAALVAAYVAAVIGFAVNDSGVQIPAVALTVAIPLTLATVARAAPSARSGIA